MAKKIVSTSLLILIIFFSTSYAGVYYLSSDGDNNNNGMSVDEPWATMQYADDFLRSPGDTLYVLGGVYSDRQYFDCNASGVEGNPIVVMTYPGHTPVFNGPGSQWEYRITMDRNWWVFDGLTMFGGGDASQPRIVLIDGDHNVLKNCKVSGNAGMDTGVMNVVRGVNSSYNEVRGCTLEYAGYLPDDSDGEALALLHCDHWIIEDNVIRYGAHGCVILKAWPNPCTYNVIRNNTIDGYPEWGHGITLVNDGNIYQPLYNLIEGNRIRSGSVREYKQAVGISGGCGNTIRKNYIYSPYYKGIVLHAYSTMVVNNNYIYNNTIYYTGKTGLQMTCDNSPETRLVNNYFANNIFYNCQQNPTEGVHDKEIIIYLYHADSWWNEIDEMGGNVFHNCLIWHQNPSDDVTIVEPPHTTYNLYNFNELITSWPKVFIDCIGDDPRFLSTSLDSITLNPYESPCIDSGIPVNDQLAAIGGWNQLTWYGEAPDIGAYEYLPGNQAPISTPNWTTRKPIDGR